MGLDPVAEDPPGDPRHPASMAQIAFQSDGANLNGVLYIPAGAGPHPTVLVLHGFPGYERNLDLAQAYRRAGWIALVFHYRGAWGSEGAFGFSHVLEDVQSALEFLRSEESQDQRRVDATRVALVGHSMGGWASLMSASSDDRLLGAASIAGWNVGLEGLAADDPAEEARLLGMFDESMGPLRGTDSEPLLLEARENARDWDLRKRATDLAGRSMFIAAGSRDAEVPPERHHKSLVESLRAAGASRLTERVWETDHAFSGYRIALARATAEWLESLATTG